ncbi:MAG: cyclase family protein [Planctomycetota bacterium]
MKVSPAVLGMVLGGAISCAGPEVVPIRGFVVPESAVVIDLTRALAPAADGRLPVDPRAGTYLAAPAATAAGRPMADRLNPGGFLGPAVVIDISAWVESDPDYRLTSNDIAAWQRRHGPIPPGAIVLLRSGWGVRWGKASASSGAPSELYLNPDKDGKPHYPGFHVDVARRLAGMPEVQGLGTDAFSVEGGGSEEARETLAAIHEAGRYTLGNLDHLDRLPESGAILIVAPLKTVEAALVPARVLALVPREL